MAARFGEPTRRDVMRVPDGNFGRAEPAFVPTAIRGAMI